ncbi:hypothetical protein KI387_041659, partial [Taxus chinensis]
KVPIELISMAGSNSIENRIMPPPPVFLSSLNEVLKNRQQQQQQKEPIGSEENEKIVDGGDEVSKEFEEDLRPSLLVTNDDGIEAPGLRCLVEALVNGGRCNVNVCAPDQDKSWISHSVTTRETLVASTVDIKGATAYEASGTPSDCVSLGLSGMLFPGVKPAMVISGIHKGSNCGHH